MEYVVVMLVVVLPLVASSDAILFNIQGLAEGDVDNFGFVGSMFTLRWRMVMSGVALPLP